MLVEKKIFKKGTFIKKNICVEITVTTHAAIMVLITVLTLMSIIVLINVAITAVT